MTDALFADLDRALGPVAMMSLQSRGLLPTPGAPTDERLPAPDVLLDRVTGALLGAAAGNALGRLGEQKQRRRGSAQFVSADTLARATLTGPSRKVRAGVQQLLISINALLEAGEGAPPMVSDRIVDRVRSLRVPGRALLATVEQRRAGMPWFEAGTGSFGEGALCRAIAAGLVLADDPVRRPVMAGLDAAVTHASQKAVHAATLVAGSIAALVRRTDALLPGSPDTSELDTALANVGLDQEAETTIAAALRVLHAHPGDPTRAIAIAASVPGNADTFAAITGALAGAAYGAAALPDRWTTHVEFGGELRSLAARIVARLVGDTTEPTGVARIWFLLDRSGSMGSISEAVVGGCNLFFSEQRAVSGEATVTFVQFDDQDPHEVVLDNVQVASVVPLGAHEFQPRGNTPLLDATALLLDRAERAGAAPTDNLVVVFTDGHENASRRWTRETLFRRISELQDKGWTFVFLGANQDSYAEGGRLGFSYGSTSNFKADRAGVQAAFSGLNRAAGEWRGKASRVRLADRERFWGDRKEAEELDD
jgi:ADP-ribosylglycohydrolase